ncbi:MAG TPA: Tox-REase-5 domain-containing protein, partial [Myxococcus sp.]|nr:Tox-REase-5 domain-containing protein [Myxococcus sp.]
HVVLVLLLALTGCGTLKPLPLSDLDSGSPRYRSASPPSFTPVADTSRAKGEVRGPAAALARGVKDRLGEADSFIALLRAAGLTELPPEGAPLSPEDAAALFDALLEQPVTVRSFGPRLAASRLLREVVEGDVEVPRAELLERVKRFEPLAVLRPDGYLAWARTGTACQRVGEVQWREGAFRAGPFEVGAFYPVLAEVHDGADVTRGTEEPFIELVLVLGELLTRSGDTVAALSQLPEGLATLVMSSPEYLERFKGMTRGEQVQSLSKLTASLLSTWGTAAGSTRTLAAMGRGWEAASVPVLSLDARGALGVERAMVSVGQSVTVLGTGPDAAVILHTAASHPAGGGAGSAAAGGPGTWGPTRQLLSPRAAHYQAQVSGRPANEAYWLGEVGAKEAVKFDGFEDGVLVEAKGPGYAARFNADLTPKPGFARAGAQRLVDEARRQHQAAKERGLLLRWHVAEERAAMALRKLLEANGLTGIEVVHTLAAF